MGKILRCLFILLGALLAVLGMVGLVKVPPLYQTIIYGEEKAHEDISQTWEGVLSTGASGIDGWAVSKISSKIAQGIEFELHAVDASYFQLFPQTVKSGRILLTQDGQYGDSCIVLDQALSQRFFGTNNSVGRHITLDNHQYKVVGVVDGSSIGVSKPVAYVTSLASEPEMAILNCRATSSDAYQYMAYKALVSGLWEDSVTYSLYAQILKETLPVRIIAAFFLAAIGVKGIYLFAAFIRRVCRDYKASLKMEYWHKHLTGAAIKILGSIVLLGAIVFSLYYLALWLIKPVYYFPEIMTRSGLDTYLGVLWSSVQYYTPQLHRLRLYAQLLQWGMVLMLTGAAITKIPHKEL